MEPDQKNHEELSDTSTTEPSDSSSSDEELYSSSDSDSTTSEDDGIRPLKSMSFDCLLIFNIDINPNTFELVYTLRAVPYIHKPEPFKSLKSHVNSIREKDKPFYEFVHREGKDDILAILKLLITNNININRTQYSANFRGLISGTYAKYFLSSDNCEFTDEMNAAFISYIDLVLRQNLQVENDKLQEQFDYQNATYGTSLYRTHIERIKTLLNEDPVNQREKQLRKYIANVTEVPSPESQPHPQPLTNMYHFIQTFLSWLSSNLGLIQPTPPVTTEITVNAACQPQAGSIQLRQEVIARLRADEYESTKALKQDLKQLFSLRRYFEPSTTYYGHFAFVSIQISKFLLGLTTPESWNDPSTIEQARKLLIEAILLTDNILADMECFLRQAGKEPTALRMAELLTDQSYAFCRDFIYTGIIDLYPSFREKTWLTKSPNMMISDRPSYDFHRADEAATTALFFKRDTPENVMLRLYKTFINDGFYQRYGIETNGKNDYREYLSSFDTRFGTWSTQDKKVEVPAAETWGQFFSRKITGAPAPVKEKYTYAHPIHHTRPT